MAVNYSWRGPFSSDEVNKLHAEAFDHRLYDTAEWDWRKLVARHSLGWVVAREDDAMIGFVNVVWDGSVHAWVQDVMVARKARHRGIGVTLVGLARDGAAAAGCEWLHVDFDEELRPFYQACGFQPTAAGLIALR